ncbi:Lipoyltransferase/lipoate-protein ligase domain-containing protein [Rozella allomycis CSF55]|uniref:Putative lipoate-protein ligase A n=1 Tax=Rozella allomycis (strain CSF55) TaxID=988480 RepID=A0A075ATP1_ROZAC|nr:Lipoyltransferase/lipoate-protein ligase domain-containing protein [Rozella allomycis CSF55]|eukprot:EPZ33603.1 Lipoyltransferase/lipoate-protein ligase domain-containing protein [Rozella allomycis CSF55]
MNIIVSKCTNPFINLGYEEFLFQKSLKNIANTFLLYRNRTCLVVGRNQNIWQECNIKFCKKNEVPILRRYSGGGTVYHDLGNSCYSWIRPRQDFDRSHASKLLADTLTDALNVDFRVNSRFDVVYKDKKISGSAFRITNNSSYHHGTLLRNSDLSQLRSCLSEKTVFFDTKAIHSVPSPCININEIGNWDFRHDDFVQHVIKKLKETQSIISEILSDSIPFNDELHSWKWVWGRTPEFKQIIEVRNKKKLILTVKQCEIIDCAMTDFTESECIELRKLIDRRYEISSLEDLLLCENVKNEIKAQMLSY